MATKARTPKKTTSANGAASNGSVNGSNVNGAKKNPGSALQSSSASDSSAAKAKLPVPSPATETSVYPSVSEEQIRRRAYELYTQRGGGHGRHVEDWFRAEAELVGRR